MVDEGGNPVLCDFGKAKQLQNDSDDITTSIEGTSLFLPPECCSFEISEHSMKKADVWSLGVTFYCMAFNRLPFPIGNTDMDIMNNICKHNINFNGRVISEEFKIFLQ